MPEALRWCLCDGNRDDLAVSAEGLLALDLGVGLVALSVGSESTDLMIHSSDKYNIASGG